MNHRYVPMQRLVSIVFRNVTLDNGRIIARVCRTFMNTHMDGVSTCSTMPRGNSRACCHNRKNRKETTHPHGKILVWKGERKLCQHHQRENHPILSDPIDREDEEEDE